MKSKFLIGVVMVVGLLAGWAEAGTFGANAGIYDHQGLFDHTLATPLTADYALQYINLNNGYIYGPTDGSGAISAANETICPALYPPDDRKVGYDSTLANQIVPEPQVGKFWHQAAVEASVQQLFVVRAWEGLDPSAAAYFGESIVFQSQISASEPPATVVLSDFQTKFPKSVPAAPAFFGSYPVALRGSGATPPRLDVRFSPVLGARCFEVQLSRNADRSAPFVSGLGSYKTYRALYDGTESTIANTYTLTLADQNQTIYYRVRAWNSFDTNYSAWTEGSIAIPANLDVSTPEAVTDLKATASGSTVTLNWTSAYDLNNSGALAACASYEIRVSSEALVDTAWTPFSSARTNPGGFSNWAAASPITAYFASHPTLPAPSIFNAGTPRNESATITSAPNGNYYFGLKAYDTSGNISYLSNVAGAQVGGGGSSQLTYLLTLESRVPTGHGINHFSMPFPGPWYAYKEDGTALGAVANAYDLVKAINTAAGSNTVSTFTAWVGALTTPNEAGIIIPNEDPDGTAALRSSLQAILLQNGTGYELYATQTVKLVIKNY